MRVATFRDTALNVTYCFHPRRFPCQHQRPPTDLINFEGLLSEDERVVAERVRAFVQREIKPNVGRWFENAELPTEIFSKLASEGLFGMHLKGYGCAGLSAILPSVATTFSITVQQASHGITAYLGPFP